MAGMLERLRAALADRYAIEREVGSGGNALVFLARDVRHHRRVALKVLRPELVASVGAERFLREIEIAAQLSHPHILPLHDSGQADGFLYYVMPYVDGETLRDRLERENQLPMDDALQILREVGDALAYAHSLGIVHRDIKPGNVLLHEGHAVVSDFGIARAVSVAGRDSLTASGLAVGTPFYMSPEQASGSPQIDARSDVYSLAAVFYEMLAGEPPHTGPTPHAILARKLSEEVRPLTPLRSVTPALDGVMRKALARSPADRYGSARQFAEAAREAVEGRLAAPMPRRRRQALTAAAVVALLAFGAVGRWFIGGARASEANTVVVLPFSNLGGDPADQAYVDGLMEILTSKLTQLEPYFERPLWVVPATEVRSRELASADEARREFGATLAVTGSVLRQGSEVRVTLNLVDARSLRQIRSSDVAGRRLDLGTWQDGVVARLAEMLDLEVRPRARQVLAAGGTTQPQAFDYYVQGRGYLQSLRSVESLNAALRLFEQAIERDSAYALAYAGLGEAYWQMYSETGDTRWVAPAVANSGRAVALNDSLPRVWVTLGLIRAGTGQYERAVEHLRRALDLDPYDSEAYRLLARAYNRLGRIAEAEATYRRAIELKPYDWRGYNSLGVFYNQQGRYEEAAGQFLKVAELTPMNVRGYSNAGGVYFFLDRWSEARRMFQRSIDIEPTPSAYSNLGTLDYYEGRFEEAARNFEHALESRQEDYRLWSNLADAYHWIPGQRDQSVAALRRAVELAEAARRVNPSDPAVLSSLVGDYAALGDRPQAAARLADLTPLVGDDPGVMFNIAVAHEVMGARQLALEWLGQALAAGYSRRIVEHTPHLRDLRSDARYRLVADRRGTSQQ